MARSKQSSTAGPRRSSGRVSAPTLKAASKTTAVATPSPRKPRSLRPRKSLSSYIDHDGEDEDEGDEDAYSDQDEDEEEEEEDVGSTQSVASEPAAPQPERGEGGRHSLRPRASLLLPEGLRDYISTDSALGHKKRRQSAPALGRGQKVAKGKRLPPGKACVACRSSRRKCDRKKPKCSGCVRAGSKCFVKEDGVDDNGDDGADEPDKHTTRGQIRKGMEETLRKRERFLLDYGHLFEPLLPENNYITKLRAKYATKTEDPLVKTEENRDTPMSGGDETEVKQDEVAAPQDISAVPYKLLESQPSR